MAILILVALAALFIAWLLSSPIVVAAVANGCASSRFPEQWRRIIRRRVPTFRHLPADLQRS